MLCQRRSADTPAHQQADPLGAVLHFHHRATLGLCSQVDSTSL